MKIALSSTRPNSNCHFATMAFSFCLIFLQALFAS